MPTCINCEQEFEAKRKDASLCSPKCRMAWSRKKAAEEGSPDVEYQPDNGGPPVSEVEVLSEGLGIPLKAIKPVSHVVALKQKVKERILAKTPPAYVPPVEAGTMAVGKEFISPTKFSIGTFRQNPVEHHGTDNSLARQVLSKVPATKLDPNSLEAELARLEKSQLRNTKKKES